MGVANGFSIAQKAVIKVTRLCHYQSIKFTAFPCTDGDDNFNNNGKGAGHLSSKCVSYFANFY